MKKLFTLFVIILLLNGCGTRIEYSQPLHERAIIVSTIYNPSIHETSIKNVVEDVPTTVVDVYGDSVTIITQKETTEITDSTIPAEYGAVFQCQHGSFVIQGHAKSQDANKVSKYEILYNKLKGHEGDTVDVIYKEIYNVTYDKDENGNEIETGRIVTDIDFIDAQLLK